ncbi:unnamed protein product, partial [Ectocarpus sp. 4 AP-2014]
ITYRRDIRTHCNRLYVNRSSNQAKIRSRDISARDRERERQDTGIQLRPP